MFFAPMGLSSCSMGSSASEMKGSLNFTQDDLTEKPFKVIDVDVIASVYYTQNNGDECSVRLDYSAIKDAEFVQKLKEKLKVVYRDGEVKIGLNGKLKVPHGAEQKRLQELTEDFVAVTAKGRPIHPKTLGQKEYLTAIRKNAITFGVGPAGTGKTYLAVAMAVKAFKSKDVSRIILTRPAVEAGEKLGFLPGDLQNKVDPYLRPLYDGLFDLLGAETFQKLFEKQVIEVAPLADMRGRTLDDAFIILDEAQNTTPEQMKMFLTRMGVGSKVVVTGDVTQIDLPDKVRSGLIDALHVLRDVEGIAQVRLTEKDVVRHRLVQQIVKAYEKAAEEKMPRQNQQ